MAENLSQETFESSVSGAEGIMVTLDFVELIKARKERADKAAELRKQYSAEVDIVEQKHCVVLEKYRSACDEMNRTLDEFKKEWAPLIADYEREIKGLRRKYNRLLKER